MDWFVRAIGRGVNKNIHSITGLSMFRALTQMFLVAQVTQLWDEQIRVALIQSLPICVRPAGQGKDSCPCV